MKTERTRKPGHPSRGAEEGLLLPVAGRLKERGIILFIALMVMALLALLGATFLTMSTTESTIATNETKMARAFNIAEAGLERAKTRIKTGTEANLDAYLTGTSPGPGLGLGTVAFDNGTYSVVIEDDADAGGNPLDDTNDRVFIRATGTHENARRQILALVRVVKVPPMPAPRGAAETLANPGIVSEIHGEPGAFDGRDWTPPADVSTCSDNTCGTLTGGTPTYGAFSNTAAIDYALGSGGTMYGTDCLVAACAGTVGTASNDYDTSVSSTRWDPYIDAMIPRANQTHPGTALANASNTFTWGTQANPQVTVINTSGDFDWRANVTGAGVLIIEAGPSQVINFTGSGELNWQGLVIIRSAGVFEFQVNKQDSLRVFGVMVNRSLTRPEIELKADGNFIKYSSAAVNMINNNLGGTFQVLNWREVAL